MQNTDFSMLNNMLMLVCSFLRVYANSYAKKTLFGDAHTGMHTHTHIHTDSGIQTDRQAFIAYM